MKGEQVFVTNAEKHEQREKIRKRVLEEFAGPSIKLLLTCDWPPTQEDVARLQQEEEDKINDEIERRRLAEEKRKQHLEREERLTLENESKNHPNRII